MALCLRLLIFAFEGKEQQWYYYAFLKALQANSGRLWEATLNISVVPREKTFCNFEAKEDFWKGSYSQLKTLSGAWRAEGSLWWGCNWACPGKTGPSWGRETAQTAWWACWSREEHLGRCSYFPLVLAVGLDIFKGGEVIMTRKIGQIWTKWNSGHLFPNKDALKYSRSKEPRIPTWGRYPGVCSRPDPVEPSFPQFLSVCGLPGVSTGSQMPPQSFCGASVPRAAVTQPLLPSLQIPGDACLAGKHSKQYNLKLASFLSFRKSLR